MSARADDQSALLAAPARRNVSTKSDGLVRLLRPHAWIDGRRAQQLVMQAYRYAAWSARHDQDRDDGCGTERFTMAEMREQFAQDFAQAFQDLLFAEAVSKGGCWPGDPAPEVAAQLMAQVPQDWDYRAPQDGRPEPGKLALQPRDNRPMGRA